MLFTSGKKQFCSRYILELVKFNLTAHYLYVDVYQESGPMKLKHFNIKDLKIVYFYKSLYSYHGVHSKLLYSSLYNDCIFIMILIRNCERLVQPVSLR